MRARMRRFTRKTTGYSRKAAALADAVDLNFNGEQLRPAARHADAPLRAAHHATPWPRGRKDRVWTMLEVTERMDVGYQIAA